MLLRHIETGYIRTKKECKNRNLGEKNRFSCLWRTKCDLSFHHSKINQLCYASPLQVRVTLAFHILLVPQLSDLTQNIKSLAYPATLDRVGCVCSLCLSALLRMEKNGNKSLMLFSQYLMQVSFTESRR